jgi:hypothetical protein
VDDQQKADYKSDYDLHNLPPVLAHICYTLERSGYTADLFNRLHLRPVLDTQQHPTAHKEWLIFMIFLNHICDLACIRGSGVRRPR